MKTSTSTLSLLLVLCTPACQGEDLSVGSNAAALERADVEDLPPGDGGEDDVSGIYLLTSFDQRSCRCSEGDEASFCDVELAADAIVLAQAGGSLEARAVTLPSEEVLVELSGGIDGDGSVLVGGINTVTTSNGDPVGETVNLVEGTVNATEGGTLIWSTRSEAVIESQTVDCSMVIEMDLNWWDPDSIASCDGDSDCHPDRPFCVDDMCSDGAVGARCTFPSDCASDICVEDACTAGNPGDPCVFMGDCVSMMCSQNVCE
ncbi:MAG: hypothetical protein ACE37F_29900 [Nannocystaceae bacterium]|nr:hypothetical protein [bacterium]